MKKVLVLVAVIGSMSFMSCKKEYTCCTPADIWSDETEETCVTEKLSKKEVKDKEEISFLGVSVPTGTVCTK